MPLPHNRKPALGYVFATTFADVFGYGLMMPVLPRLIAGLTGSDIGTAALYGGWLAFAYAIVQIFFAPLLGNLGDRRGRRPVLALSLLPLGIDALLLSFAPSAGWLFAGKILGGTVGGSYGAASAYLADCTVPEKRSRAFGFINAAAGAGVVVGPVIGGLLAKTDPYLPCYVAAALSAANILYALLFVPESLGREARRPFEWRRANPVGAVVALRRSPLIRGLVVAMGLFYVASDAMESVWSYFTIERFAWTEQQIGWSMGAMGLAFALVQGVVCPLLLPRIGDRRAVYLGLGLQMAALVGFGLAVRGWMLYAMLLPYAAGTVFGPAMQSMMANRTPDTAQGELQGGLSALRNMTSIVGPPLMTGLFAFFTREGAGVYFPGAPYLFAAAVMLAAFLVARRALRTK